MGPSDGRAGSMGGDANSQVLYEGWLTKKGEYGWSSWRRRWFALHKDGGIYYYKEKPIVERDALMPEPLGRIQGFERVIQGVEMEQLLHRQPSLKCSWPEEAVIDMRVAVPTEGRVYFLFADDEESLGGWVNAIESLLKLQARLDMLLIR
eukprot:m.341367 g.341367  ORF g.341367 m.341367 type:complete len:150 (+) comp20064_c0_seq1:272-721(+)